MCVYRRTVVVGKYLDAEDVAVVAARWVGDQVRDAFPAVGCEFFEENLRLRFGKGPHCECVYVRCESCDREMSRAFVCAGNFCGARQNRKR